MPMDDLSYELVLEIATLLKNEMDAHIQAAIAAHEERESGSDSLPAVIPPSANPTGAPASPVPSQGLQAIALGMFSIRTEIRALTRQIATSFPEPERPDWKRVRLDPVALRGLILEAEHNEDFDVYGAADRMGCTVDELQYEMEHYGPKVRAQARYGKVEQQ
jgi:hypothetical protein